ncbi:MAG: exopolyphosphatase [Gammaproteobacteria bacterium]
MLGFGTAFVRPPEVLAAVDLGSNSFHMIVARMEDGQLHVIDRLREMVSLASGLDTKNHLSDEAQERAITCLERFGQRLRDLPPGSVRAVGTNTLRRARGSGSFLARAEQALGHPIEVIAGREEARLIYLGVSHGRAGDEGNRLVIDIGGGSTEVIVGEGFETLSRDSLFMGSVSWTRAHFADGRINRKTLAKAELAAQREIGTIATRCRELGWNLALGCSGTVRAVGAVLKAQGWSDGAITPEGMARLRQALIDAGQTDNIVLSGLKDERRPVFAGGFAVLNALVLGLDIDRLSVSDMALREGLLYDLVGRLRHDDVRNRTVNRLAKRLGVDTTQARRVEQTAVECLRQVATDWALEGEPMEDTLRWAARLHEVGLVISRNQHHKHGHYMLSNADMAGFSRREQAVLAALVRGHRRRFPLDVFDTLPDAEREAAIRLCVLLRLAVVLHRGRIDGPSAPFELKVGRKNECKLKLRLPADWLADHPLTLADLQEESEFLKATQVRLKVTSVDEETADA